MAKWIALGIIGCIMILISIVTFIGSIQSAFNVPSSSQGATALLNFFESHVIEVIVEFIVFVAGIFVILYAYAEGQKIMNPGA